MKSKRRPGFSGLRLLLVVIFGLPATEPLSNAATSGDFPKFFNTQEESVATLTPLEAAARIQVPPGFRVTLFAGEPDVHQPIAMTFDTRGRLWVAENFTYADRHTNYDKTLRDRLLILEDADGDGRFDKRTVFWDGAQKLTSMAVGFGGVFALCPPQLLFLPDQNGDDIPDGQPEVLLDGWDDDAVRHNIANGLKLGPDGWLYGRHGILATSHVGKPGTPKEARATLNCGMWRFHPVTRKFEIVAQGTTNPWGHDWDDHGELFFINTVIGHLWHVIPGAYYKRMYGEHFNPYLYELIDQTADHFHWDTKETWDDIRKLGVTATTSEAGGGHAHSGMMIYLADNWPKEYRHGVFTVNYHGRRLNRDTLERRGAGYVARHARDFMQSGDPWFKGIEMIYGPDGGVYLADWSDIGECHDNDGIHRTSGRIFKIVYGTPERPRFADTTQWQWKQLVEAQLHANEWYGRAARQRLQEQAAQGVNLQNVHTALRKLFDDESSPSRKLRALWSLYVSGGASESWLRQLLDHESEPVRVWAVKLLVERQSPSADVIRELTTRARSDASGLVLSFLAASLQRIPETQRWPLAEALSSRREFATDPVLPLMIWYGIESAVPKSPEPALKLAASSAIPKVRRFVARRLIQNGDSEKADERLVDLIARSTDSVLQADLLAGMSDALTGIRKATPPDNWRATAPALLRSANASVARLAEELSAVFGDGRALDALRKVVVDKSVDLAARRRALQTLVQSRADNLLPVAKSVFDEIDISADAIRGLATLAEAGTDRLLVNEYLNLKSGTAKMEAINTLASRPAFARTLLDAVQEGRIPRPDVTAVQIRQLRSLGDAEIDKRVTSLWPELRQLSADKQQQVQRYKQMLTAARMAGADRPAGRALYQQVCGTCHVLFGEGGKIGPDLTGSDRRNLDYLLENIIDPSGIVPDTYRMSVIDLKDGRVLNGIIGAKTEKTIAIQTPTEQLTLEKSEIETIAESKLSLMPEGLLESFNEQQVSDLIAYLMSPTQVPLNKTAEKSAP